MDDQKCPYCKCTCTASAWYEGEHALRAARTRCGEEYSIWEEDEDTDEED